MYEIDMERGESALAGRGLREKTKKNRGRFRGSGEKLEYVAQSTLEGTVRSISGFRSAESPQVSKTFK